jgi:hypothetical protein
LFPKLRKMPLVASDEIVGAGSIGAFEKHVVIRVASRLVTGEWVR